MICLFSSFKKNGLKKQNIKQNHTKVQKMLQTFLMWVKKKKQIPSHHTRCLVGSQEPGSPVCLQLPKPPHGRIVERSHSQTV